MYNAPSSSLLIVATDENSGTEPGHDEPMPDIVIPAISTSTTAIAPLTAAASATCTFPLPHY